MMCLQKHPTIRDRKIRGSSSVEMYRDQLWQGLPEAPLGEQANDMEAVLSQDGLE